MLGDARYAVRVVSIDQWRQISSQREQEIARQITAGKAGHDVVTLPASPASEALVSAGTRAGTSGPQPPGPLTARSQQAEQEAASHESEVARYRRRTGAPIRNWVIAEAAAFVLGLVFVGVGAEINSPDAEPATPGAPELWTGGTLIAAAIIGVVVTIVTAALRYNNAERLSRQKGNPAPWIVTLLGCIASLIIGAVIIIANSANPAGKGATDLGVFFIVAGLLGGLAWLVAKFPHAIKPQRESYKRSMATLTPQERAGVYAAQAAGMMLAHEAMKHSNQRARERRAVKLQQHEEMRQFIQGLYDKRSQPPQYGQAS
jgi:fluoride ion exporter CrcB/FEX